MTKPSASPSTALLPYLDAVSSPATGASLDDFCDRKSFGYKAEVRYLQDKRAFGLYSYRTLVAFVRDGKLYRAWDGWSATTGRHFTAFSRMMGFGWLTKKDWDRLEVASL